MNDERDNCLYGSYYEFYYEMKKSKTIRIRLSSYGNSVMYLDEYNNKILSTRSCDYNYETKEVELESGKHYIRIEYFPSTYKYDIKLEISDDNGITYNILNKENCHLYDGIISNIKYEEIYVNPNSYILLKPEILSGNVIKYENKSVITSGLNLNSKNGLVSGILEECIENNEITIECIGNSNSIETQIIIHCYCELESDYSMEIRRIQNDLYDKTLKLNSFIHNPIIFESLSMKNHKIPLNEINIYLSNCSYIITYSGIIDKETMNKIKIMNIKGKYKRIKMIILNEKEYIYDNNLNKELFNDLSINIKSKYNSNIKIIINVDNMKDFQSLLMKVNNDINILSLLKRVSVSSFYYPSKYMTFYFMDNIFPIIYTQISKSMNNPFKFKINPSVPKYLIFNERTGRINYQRYNGADMYDYIQYTITMYNDKVSYSYSIYLRYFYNHPIMVNMNDEFVVRNDRFYHPIQIEGIYTSFNISETDSIILFDEYVLSGYLNMIDGFCFDIYYFDIKYSEYMHLDDYGNCNRNSYFVVIVDIFDLDTNIEVGIYNINKELIIEQKFNHSYVSMYHCLYEGIYNLTYNILNYDSEKKYNNTITYGFSSKIPYRDGILLNKINISNRSETYQFNIPYDDNMNIWYDEIVFTDENEKYIDLYPKTNNPSTYELNKDIYHFEIDDKPDNLKFNKSTGRLYGNISYKDFNDFIFIDLYYEDELIDFCSLFGLSLYHCKYPHVEVDVAIFENKTINCENGYYGERIMKCFYDEKSDDGKWEIIDADNCKKVKTKPNNENEAIVIISLTIHLEDNYLLLEYEESVWINSFIKSYMIYVRDNYYLAIDEVSILSNEKDLESGNVKITIQYTTIKKEIDETIKRIESKFHVNSMSLLEAQYFFQHKPFYISSIEVIQHYTTNDLYFYLGIFSGIVIIVIIVCVIRIICKYLVYKEFKKKNTFTYSFR